ncbi:AMP-binding protein [Pseudokineococcus marinus]|uniref:Acyl-CoA synthetase n=1 Tax=Pseudokineococcus marinus TaxID=351215 RepID=A0A849C1L4_9ACTN|nr:AMP-dependent synthetase/ligase [Pseudokineococcus marinus]NNH23578.1 AMP-binding protein [Pseudokineococcus marinus]
MRESSRPPLVEVDHGRSLAQLVVDAAREVPEAVSFRRPDGSGGWTDVTAAAFLADVEAVARGLVAAGVEPGDRVGLLSRTRYEWTLVDFAIWTAGAVTVPIYETSSRDQVAWVLEDSGARCVVVETAVHAGLVQRARPEGDDGPTWAVEDGGLDELRRLGRDVDPAELDRRRAALTCDSPATLIYTSGTTGRPRGCVLSHGNFLVLAENGAALLRDLVRREDASTLLFLPLAHVLARYIQVLAVVSRTPLGHTSDPKHLADDLASFRPTFVLSVPRVFEKIYNGAEAKADAAGRGDLFRRAAGVAERWSRAQDAGGPGLGLRLQHALFDRLVYGRVRAAMGGRLDFAVSGGAPLGERLGHFFRGVGVTVLEGYGLTESTAPTAVGVPDELRIGTVGRPLPGTSVRVGDDGEVQLKGPHITSGYWRDEEATRAAFVDGWFRTGDLGHLDDDGYLRITGRSKEIIVTAAGKNVAPAVLEDRLRAAPLVGQCMVVGDGRPFVGALLTLDPDMLPLWLRNHGLPEGTTPAEAAAMPEVRAELQRAVDSANEAVSRAESIRRFAVLPADLTEESGHLTPSLKLKRAAVLRDHADRVEEIYAS